MHIMQAKKSNDEIKQVAYLPPICSESRAHACAVRAISCRHAAFDNNLKRLRKFKQCLTAKAPPPINIKSSKESTITPIGKNARN